MFTGIVLKALLCPTGDYPQWINLDVVDVTLWLFVYLDRGLLTYRELEGLAGSACTKVSNVSGFTLTKLMNSLQSLALYSSLCNSKNWQSSSSRSSRSLELFWDHETPRSYYFFKLAIRLIAFFGSMCSNLSYCQSLWNMLSSCIYIWLSMLRLCFKCSNSFLSCCTNREPEK